MTAAGIWAWCETQRQKSVNEVRRTDHPDQTNSLDQLWKQGKYKQFMSKHAIETSSVGADETDPPFLLRFINVWLFLWIISRDLSTFRQSKRVIPSFHGWGVKSPWRPHPLSFHTQSCRGSSLEGGASTHIAEPGGSPAASAAHGQTRRGLGKNPADVWSSETGTTEDAHRAAWKRSLQLLKLRSRDQSWNSAQQLPLDSRMWWHFKRWKSKNVKSSP